MNKEEFIKKYNMKELSTKDGFQLEIVYATKNNFTKQQLYNRPICMLREKTARKLLNANNALKKYGYKIKIWDSFRPIESQKKMWGIYPDERFVKNPNKEYSNHCKGCSVDITLCTLDNKEVKMPTAFDHFGKESYRNYYVNLAQETVDNIVLLENIMKLNGFSLFPFEWWHFDDVDNYDVIYEMYNE